MPFLLLLMTRVGAFSPIMVKSECCIGSPRSLDAGSRASRYWPFPCCSSDPSRLDGDDDDRTGEAKGPDIDLSGDMRMR